MIEDQMDVVGSLTSVIESAIRMAKEISPSREMSLVITKLEEALMWGQKVKVK